MTDRLIDDLGRALARPITRRRTMRLFLAGGAALALPPLRPRFAFAGGNVVCYEREETPDRICTGFTCPPNTTCCSIPRQPRPGPCETNPSCCDPCDPEANQCNTGTGRCGPGGAVPDYCECGEFDDRCGDDCCRGLTFCCDRIFSFKDPQCCPEEEKLKEACSDGKYGEGLITLAAGVGALVTGGASALAFGAVGAASGAAGLGFDICENDPPDPDYKGLFRPKVPTLPRVRTGGQVSRAAARAVNKMLVNQARSSAYITAWIRSIEKSQGAAQAGDTEWVRRQRDAAAKHARNAAAKLQRDVELRRAARRELQRSGALDVAVTAKQTRRLKGQIKRRGLPEPTLRALRSAGANGAEVAQVKRTLLAVNPNAVADLGVFGEVNDPRFRKANATMIQTLRRSANSLSSA